MIKKQLILIVLSIIILIISQLIALCFPMQGYKVERNYSFFELPGWVGLYKISKTSDKSIIVYCAGEGTYKYYGFPFYTVKRSDSCKYTNYLLNPLASLINLAIILILLNLFFFVLGKIIRKRKKN